MAKPALRTPRPVAFVFALGTNAKVGKKHVPEAYAASACCLYRAAEKERSVHLDAIPEDDVADADAEIVFAAIELAIERAHLLHELSTDREIDGGKSPAYTTGFHPNAPFEDVCAALERGGFTVVRVMDPLGTQRPNKVQKTEGLDRSLQRLVRALEHASLESVLGGARDEELSFHATAAEDLVGDAFEAAAGKPFIARVIDLAKTLDPEGHDTLVVVVARLSRAADDERAGAIRDLLARLGPPHHPGVKKLLADWKLSKPPAR